MFVGIGASRVRLFLKPNVIHRALYLLMRLMQLEDIGAGLGGGHDEREQTLNQILVEMDGFGTDDSVIILAATNRPDVLDKALLRPGRFDRQIIVDVPDMKGREAILKIHPKVPLSSDVNLSTMAKYSGLVGADLKFSK